MPLPISPAIPINPYTGDIEIPSTLLQPWFNTGEVKALTDLLTSYTTDVLEPKIEAALTGGGSSGDKTYRHVQGSAASVWNVTHNLAKRPSVTVVDSGGSEVEGDIIHISDNQTQLLFSAAFSGEAYFN